jgi:molybdate transport system substrate-binding protein
VREQAAPVYSRYHAGQGTRMKRLLLALAFLGGFASPVCAAELKVMTVGLVGGGFHKLAQTWSRETGNTVKLVIPPSALDQVLAALKTKDADAVLLPMTDLADQARLFRPGTTHAIGRVLFGLGGKQNGPKPDISSEAAFKAAMAGKTVLVNDPATSLNGRMAKAMFNGPGFETVTVRGAASSAAALARSDADYVVTVMSEEAGVSTLALLGEVPPTLGLKIDFGGGVTARAADPELAAQFLAYLRSAQAASVWKAGGVMAPVP